MSPLEALAKQWRKEARAIFIRMKNVDYIDQTSRVLWAKEMRILRRAARDLTKVRKAIDQQAFDTLEHQQE